jgi:hypothetical protein
MEGAGRLPPIRDQLRSFMIEPIDRDNEVRAPSRDQWVTVRAADFAPGHAPKTWGFTGSADILVRSMLDLPARTHGEFTELAVDLHAPLFPARPDCLYEVDLLLRGSVIETKVFRNFTQRHQFIVSTQLLFEDINELTVLPRAIVGGPEEPRFFVRFFYVQKDRLTRIMERTSIWVFSTARSGSTWLSQDLLCWNDGMRPMDEPGYGKMFAPLDWTAERFYRLAERNHHIESGYEFETRAEARRDPSVIPPFERTFMFAGQENQIFSAQNSRMYLELLRETVFRHVLNEWGMIEYQTVVFKMPNDAHAADIVMQAFPESFMIFLMRDGRDVLKSRFSPFASRTLAEQPDPELRSYAIAFYSHFWNFQVDIIQAAFRAHSPERSLFVCYEDLRRNTREQLRLIFDRVGSPIDEAQLSELLDRTTLENIPDDQKGPDKPRQTGQIGKYTEVFSESEIELMESIMGPNLQRFGYTLFTEQKEMPHAVG